jgi:hypothetical protein
MAFVKCANSRCGEVTELPRIPKKFICPKCGVLNTPQTEGFEFGDEACGCLLPTGFEWKLPAGRIQSPLGDMYITADDGTVLTRLEWIEIYGYDPKIALDTMRKLGAEGVPGYVNLSTLGKKKQKGVRVG